MTVHVPILLERITETLLPDEDRGSQDSGTLIDCTLGGGGHLGALMARAHALGMHKLRFVGIDRDPEAIERAKAKFHADLNSGRLELRQGAFSEVIATLKDRPWKAVLADFGVSSDQLDSKTRGFSFRWDGPLDLRMDPTQGESAAERLMTVSATELTHILREWGGERFAERISNGIVTDRSQNPREPWTVERLKGVVVRSVPRAARHGRIHVATRTFQALRIWVNDELSQIDALLEHVILGLQSGGRAAFLSFHSLEDGRVKRWVRAHSDRLEALTKKPIVASDEEVEVNPRARSAMLRLVRAI